MALPRHEPRKCAEDSSGSDGPGSSTCGEDTVADETPVPVALGLGSLVILAERPYRACAMFVLLLLCDTSPPCKQWQIRAREAFRHPECVSLRLDNLLLMSHRGPPAGGSLLTP